MTRFDGVNLIIKKNSMDLLKNINWKKLSIPKLIGVGILAVIFLTVSIWLLGFAFRTAFFGPSQLSYPSSVPSAYYGESGGVEYEQRVATKEVSRGFLPPVPPRLGGSVGTDAEEFEVTEYAAHIRTGNLDRTCLVIEDLKPRSDVIFENANRYDRGCSYTFKVKNESADEVLAVIKSLKPKTLEENTTTIRPIIDDYVSEVEILEKKLASVEETLTSAMQAYDEVSVLATRTQNVESLASIIDSKVKLIERLAQERITIKERIDWLNKSEADQLDRLNFTFFSVNVSEFLLFDLKAIKDSWTSEFQSFVREFNDVLQDVTINLAEFLLRLIQAALYFLIALFILKYGWRLTKRIWKA